MSVLLKGSGLNIHLLVSPDDPQHIAELKRFLARLTFRAHEDTGRAVETTSYDLVNASPPN